MPLLAALVGSGFVAIATFLATYIGKKLAVGAALGAFLVAGWIAFELAIKAIADGVSWAAPGWMAGPLSVAAYLLPSNLDACLTACMTALFARYVWDAQREWARSMAAV